MGRASRARRVAAYGGGGLGALGLGVGATFYGLVVGQSRLARRRIPVPESAPPAAHDTIWSAPDVPADRDPISVAWLGDSLAAGYGVHRDVDTPAVRNARAVSAITHQPVLATDSDPAKTRLAQVTTIRPADTAPETVAPVKQSR